MIDFGMLGDETARLVDGLVVRRRKRQPPLAKDKGEWAVLLNFCRRLCQFAQTLQHHSLQA